MARTSPASIDDVIRALDLMRRNHVRRLPVVNVHGFLIGLLSMTDIVRYHAVSEADLESALEHLAQRA